MLFNCPECSLPVSEKAIACPHCGLPLKQTPLPERKRRAPKRKRLPNGFGQISEIKNRNLRKPFRAMVTIGKTETGQPICKPLKPESYFETYNDAYSALIEYHKNPYDLSDSTTLEDLYNRWIVEYKKTVKDAKWVNFTWPKCASLASMRVVDIRPRHIKSCLATKNSVSGEDEFSSNSKVRVKTLLNLLLDYAVEYEVINTNYARNFALSDDVFKNATVDKEHIPFTKDEMELLWSNLDVKGVDIVLIQCYSGWRPQEVGMIELADVDLSNWTFKCGSKTEAGMNRTVPIHSKIRPLVQKHYEISEQMGNKYLITWTMNHTSNMQFTYNRFFHALNNIIAILKLNPDHRPHDGRKTFVTLAKKYNVDEYAIKYIVGHKINDITEKVYTKRDSGWLHQEIEKIEAGQK